MRQEDKDVKSMLAKIRNIKNLGLVFEDFAWSAITPAFKKVNFLYGWNGCGKTTLTRLFDAISVPSQSTIEYELECQDGSIVRTGDEFVRPIRVFNKDYVEANVRIVEYKACTISVLLGEENKELLAQIEADERDLNGDPSDPALPGKVHEFQGYTQKKKRKEKDNETTFTDVAKTISAATTGSASPTRNYRSPDAKRDFEALHMPTVLADDVLDAKILSIRQVPLPELPIVQRPTIEIEAATTDAIDTITVCLGEATKLLPMTVEAQVLERLAVNPNISEWVEHGLRLHTEMGAKHCEYCGSPLREDRVAELSRHFSDADRTLKAKLDVQIIALRQAYATVNNIQVPDQARLYQELQTDFALAHQKLAASNRELLVQVTALGKELQEKKLKTTDPLILHTKIVIDPIVECLSNLNAIIDAHNRKSKEFQQIQNDAILAIKTHYLSEIHADVVARTTEIRALSIDLAQREAELDKIRKRIDENRTKISSDHRACEHINQGLRTFLGRDELKFEPETSADGENARKKQITGYRIVRGDKPALSLSEGEKTAIAFVYFVVHLNDGQFQKANGIVVIDDPISSLDSNSMYQAFSFLKNAVVGCLQTFVLTHNFEFLKLLLNWRERAKGETGYYMINNQIIGGVRRATIQQMDSELRDYESEYHYLFKRLRQMQVEQDGSIMAAYPVPNIARKVWETFLMFRVPNSKSSYVKMDILKQAGHDAVKLDAIYKFTNDQSHMTGAGFNPALVPETIKVLQEMFEMMRNVSPDHFAILDAATQ